MNLKRSCFVAIPCVFLTCSFASHAQVALSAPITIAVPRSLLLRGTADYTAGSLQDTGTLTLEVQSDHSTQETWNLGSIKQTFTQGSFQSGRVCSKTDSFGTASTVGDAGCFRVVPWFAPWMASKIVLDGLATATKVTLPITGSGQTTLKCALIATPVPADLPPALAAAQAQFLDSGSVTVTSDSATGLAARLDFADYATSDPASRIETYILFSDYSLESGLMIPHHIRRYLQRTLQLDVHVTSVTVN